MKKRTILSSLFMVLSGIAYFALQAGSAHGLELAWNGQASLMFNDVAGTYNYCPSSFLMDGREYIYYCSNKNPYQVIDHIALTERLHGDGSVVAAKQYALTPGPSAWEALHNCDPSIIKGHFVYQGVTFNWALFYLGEDDAPIACMHNQIGVAFAQSPEGPWVKYANNPIVTFDSYDYWGVGQPSAINLDQNGRVLLLYTRGDQYGTRTVRRELQLANMDQPVIGLAYSVSGQGLTGIGGATDTVLNNADFMYDRTRDLFYCVRDRHPTAHTVNGDVVDAEVQVACMSGQTFLNATTGTWQVLGNVSQTQTGKARNHNSGFLRDPYGELPDPHSLTVCFCGSDVANLWSYRLYRITGTLSDVSQANTLNYTLPYTPDDQTVFLFHTDDNGGTAHFVPNAAASGWGGHSTAVDSDAQSRRFDTDVPSPEFQTSVFFSGNSSWPRIDALVDNPATLNTYENYTNQLTLEAWIKPASFGGLRRIISRANCHFLYLNGDEVEFWTDFNDASDMSDSIAITTAINLQPNVWHHVAGVWNGSMIAILVDGKMVTSRDEPGKGSLRRPTASDWLVIGAAPWPGENFQGNMDEIRISKQARLNLVPVELSSFDIE